MAKLNMYLGKRYSIIPNHLHDLAHIGIYDNDGKMIKQTNGNELYMNIYSCSNCEKTYHFEQVKHDFCPFCGTKYKYVIDVSI
jgi:rubrerythrin